GARRWTRGDRIEDDVDVARRGPGGDGHEAARIVGGRVRTLAKHVVELLRAWKHGDWIAQAGEVAAPGCEARNLVHAHDVAASERQPARIVCAHLGGWGRLKIFADARDGRDRVEEGVAQVAQDHVAAVHGRDALSGEEA